MNAVDIVVLAALALGAVNGFRRGFIVQTATILGSLVALAVARAEYRPVRNALAQWAPHSPWLTAIAYLIVFLVVWSVIVGVAQLVRRVARLLLLGWADRFGGVVVGLLQSALVLELLLYLGKRLPNADLHRLIARSTLAPLFVDIIPFLDKLFPHLPR